MPTDSTDEIERAEIDKALDGLVDRRSDHHWSVSMSAQEDIAELMHDREAGLRAEIATLKTRIETLVLGLRAVECLINDSRDVGGLHLNGDAAPWDELRTGGQFESWLFDFDAALAAAEGEKGP